nr:putative wax ester synthase/acyl-CoA:diacylglycerol acyltransferase [uncultured bacterium]
MAANHHHGRLSATDASFLYFEREEAPMHIGALCILEAPLDFEEYFQYVVAKLGKLPRFREKVVNAPLLLGHPTWETDGDFDPRQHIVHHRLDRPGGEAELRAKVNELIEGKMPRDRPLWEFHILDGLADGRSALVSKVHHAMVDGVGGNAILTALFDISPQGAQLDVASPGPAYEPTVPADFSERLLDALRENARVRVDLFTDQAKSLVRGARSAGSESSQTSAAVLLDRLPEMAFPPRRLPFNRRCNGKRDFHWTSLSFSEARAIRANLGGTVNDVVLAGLAGACGSYLAAHGEKVAGRKMRLMVPVNVRAAGEGGALGNQVSILPVDVPLDLQDPIDRMRAIRGRTRSMKEGRIAELIHSMSQLSGAVPPLLQAALGSVAFSPYPVFNMVCTNVPGPQIPLYAMGRRLLEYYPHVPVGWDLGVCCAIFSYDQKLFIGLNADLGACDDAGLLRELLDGAFAELKAVAGVPDLAHVEVAKVVEISVPPERAAAARNGAAKKRASKKTAGKKRAASKKAASRVVSKKATSKKATSKKAPARKVTTKEATPRKAKRNSAAQKKVASKKSRQRPRATLKAGGRPSKRSTKKTARSA